MADKQPNTVFGGCLGSLIGLVAGGGVGAAVAQALGFERTGSALPLLLDLLGSFCVGGGAVIGAIAGREIGKVMQRRSNRRG